VSGVKGVLVRPKSYLRPARRAGRVATIGALIVLSLALTGCATDQSVTLSEDLITAGSVTVSTPLQLALLLTLVTLLPALLTMVTAFTRIVIVLSFVRNAVGTPQTPPTQVVIGLSLILTFFVMAPAWDTVNAEAVQPYLEGRITHQEAYERGVVPVRAFMLEQAREKDLSLFVHLAELAQPETPDDIPTYVLVPAFVVSELKTAFQMGFMIFVPFLVIDLLISSTLMSMGMMMLPPSLISMPFKILLFVMVDGWHLIIKSLIESFA